MIPRAYADDRIVITQITDFWVEFDTETVFLAQTYQSGDLGSDPQLWLYNEAGDLLVTNDDYVDLQSKIDVVLVAGRYRLRAGTCCYNPEVWNAWTTQYELSYNGSQSVTIPPEPTTTTTEPTTTTTTTTTIPETTTTWVPTTTSTTTTTTTTTTVPPTTVPATVVPPTVTTTGAPTPTTTTPPSTTNPSTTTSSEPSPTLPPTTTTSTTTTSLAPTTTATTSIPLTAPPTSTTLPTNEIPPSPSANEIVTYLETITPEDLATLDSEQITELITDIANTELTDEQAEQIAQALTDAPTDIKEAFQEAINVFGGQFDSYVPTGSTVPVGTRRTLIAVTTATFAASTPISRKKTK